MDGAGLCPANVTQDNVRECIAFHPAGEDARALVDSCVAQIRQVHRVSVEKRKLQLGERFDLEIPPEHAQSRLHFPLHLPENERVLRRRELSGSS